MEDAVRMEDAGSASHCGRCCCTQSLVLGPKRTGLAGAAGAAGAAGFRQQDGRGKMGQQVGAARWCSKMVLAWLVMRGVRLRVVVACGAGGV
jgi:hypothetical protein